MIQMQSEQPRLYQKLAKKIKKNMLSQLEVGEKLPTEREIAKRYEVSRTIVREAIIMLELENLVEVKKGSGIYVKQKDNIATLSHQIGPFEHLQARQIVESNIAKLAAVQITKQDMIAIQEILEKEKEKILHSHISDNSSDAEFHLAIAQATQNSAFVEMVKSFWDWRETSPMWQKLNAYTYNIDSRKKWLKDHENIFSAIYQRKHDEAHDAMWQHIENVKDLLIELSDSDEPSFDRFLFQDTPTLLSKKTS